MLEPRRTHQASMVVPSVGFLAGLFLFGATTQVFLYQPATVLAEAATDNYETVSGTLGKVDLTANTGTITTFAPPLFLRFCFSNFSFSFFLAFAIFSSSFLASSFNR